MGRVSQGRIVSKKIWCWTALDCSDGETPEAEQFALKFGSEELAGGFHEAFNKARAQAEPAPYSPPRLPWLT